MRDLNASVSGHTAASAETALALLNDVEGYRSWYPAGVKQIEVRERNAEGIPNKVFTVLAVTQGPIQRDFDMEMSVERGEHWVQMSRLPKRPGDKEALAVRFGVEPAGSGSTITASFNATLSIPGWLPLGGIEKAIPQGFLDAALAQLR